MWDLIVSVPDHCLSFYSNFRLNRFWALAPTPKYLLGVSSNAT